jgi:hypothetical protein
MATWYNGDDTYLVTGNITAAEAYKDSLAVNKSFGSPALNLVGDDDVHNAEDFETKLVHRFRVRFGVFKQIGQHLKTITKPNVTFAEVEVPKLNTKVYFAGRKTQDAMSIEIDDSLDNAVAKATQTQLQKQANFDTSLHAKSSAGYFFNVTAEELSGDGTALLAWYYDKCVVMSCDYGTLDYSDDGATANVTLSVRYANFTTWIHDFQYASANPTEKDPTNAQPSDPGSWK